MTTVFAKRTFHHEDEDQWYKFTAELTHLKGNSDAYLSITGEAGGIHTWPSGKRSEKAAHSFGCLHDDFARIFPGYARALHFHLAGPRTGPMHYIANGLYHLGLSRAFPDARNLEAFARHAAIGSTATLEGEGVMQDMRHTLTMYDQGKLDHDKAVEMATKVLNAYLPTYLEFMHCQLDNLFPDSELFGTDWNVVPQKEIDNE